MTYQALQAMSPTAQTFDYKYQPQDDETEYQKWGALKGVEEFDEFDKEMLGE